MEVTIYADVLFAVCFLMVFTAYGAAALICGIRTGIKRLVAGSAAVSLLSSLSVLCLRSFINPVSIFALVMLGTYLCLGQGFGGTEIKSNLVCSFVALICGVLAGGLRTALKNTGICDSAVSGGVITAAILYICFFAVMRRLRAVTVKKQRFCRLTVCRGSRSAELTALVDTGNELGAESFKSVIIAERRAVEPLFEGADTALRLLPYKSVGREGVLFGILCDYAVIDGVKKYDVIVAAADTRLGGGMYNALVSPEVI